MSLENNIFY